MVCVVDVRDEASVEEMAAVLRGLLLILGQAAAHQPPDQARATEHAAVRAHAPPTYTTQHAY
jgi:hypothetical protein